MQKRVLIITGMHRSGTSLITQWLTKCGLQTGERLVPGGNGNIEGHFEDIEFLKMHEEILADHNLPTSGLTVGHVAQFTVYEKEKLRSVIKVKQQLYDQWGWKDPRTCLFLDVYKELLPDACYLVILRDYQSVVSSLLRREFKWVDNKYMARKYFSRLVWQQFRRSRRMVKFYNDQATEYLKVWIAYNQDILKCIKTLSRDAYVVVNYSMLKNEDAQVFEYLRDKWNLALKYSRFKDIFKENLIGPDVAFEQYIKDKTLIAQAVALQDELKGYMLTD
ncbi:sulfotransferase [Mucilaginibacter sp. SMC90]|uniref:sulfotransferase n=1 Tax=Mucilaginibacter sp. SMC90 TaxID=2929803 RepID=UPI001FB23B0F|nr:sulfotransferase [Mucilaginibacter sp. SMC90]UOE48045.1 sulfotransferase [Mucilaginibacter sp. SMC90]